MQSIIPPPPPNSTFPVSTTLQLNVIPENTKKFFYWLILTISVLAVIGNILAIRSIIERKTKFLQKACIFTLSLTDILTVIVFAMNDLDMLSKPLITWTLGKPLCYFLPTSQIFATTVSSLILMVIAMDRYRNCIQSFSKCVWNPKPIVCVMFIICLLLLCAGGSYPVYAAFNYEALWVLKIPYTAEEADYELSHMCYGTKAKLKTYLVTVDIIIFAPLFLAFTWFYIQIASLIWKHRKPVGAKFNNFDNKSEDSTSNSTKSTNVTTIENVKPVVKPKKQKNVQVQRKIRTFRIVIVLMLSFIGCRFPYWFYYTVRVVSIRNDNMSWNLHFALVALNLLNCVLNPLLYTFLNQSVAALKIIKEFMLKICCWCFSNDDFDEFERNNPFNRDQVNPACGTVKTRPKYGLHDKNDKVQKY
ncbi:uncharacterized protein [Diabrotica undecimpunctata]|uniref:uncharacterized protein n=1 Tax=Diabrotica undecimpunctata TaxID=50387 RepID=UPI003B63D650